MSTSIQQRDIRSASVPFKRDREHHQKWSNGTRAHHGVPPTYEVIVDGVIQTKHSWNAHGRAEPTKAEIMQRSKVRPNAIKSIMFVPPSPKLEVVMCKMKANKRE